MQAEAFVKGTCTRKGQAMVKLHAYIRSGILLAKGQLKFQQERGRVRDSCLTLEVTSICNSPEEVRCCRVHFSPPCAFTLGPVFRLHQTSQEAKQSVL
jgi:hypothetical protein